MELASFTGFLKMVLYIILFYYLFKFVARLLFPILVKKAVNHAEESFKRQYERQHTEYQKKEGDISIDPSTMPKPRQRKKVGEYVDYEEIE